MRKPAMYVPIGISVNLTQELDTLIREIARERQITINALMNEIVEGWVKLGKTINKNEGKSC